MLLPAAEALQKRETEVRQAGLDSRSSTMDTILTWSGSASHEVASFFREWLKGVLPGIQPWISSEDIAKGKKWFPELMGQLTKTSVSITFITPENVHSPWVYYEVGVIAAKNEGCIICPYLVGVEPNHVRDTPLGQFQCTSSKKDDTFRLIRSINEGLGDGRHDEQLLKGNFNSQWPELKCRLDGVMEGLTSVEDDVLDIESPIEQQLSDQARQLLLEASEDVGGRILFLDHSEGYQLLTNNKDMLVDQAPRTVALWKAALNELQNLGLIKDIGYSGDAFVPTKSGYEVADLIKSRI
jgi:hypothetical protein